MEKSFFQIFGKICFMAVIFVAALLSFEFYVRYKNSSPKPLYEVFKDSSPYQLRPYIMFTYKKMLDYNDLGYPGSLPSKDKPPNTYRIFIIGGSAVQAGEPTLPREVEKEIHNVGFKNVEVYNFGVGSSVMRQEVMRIITDIAPYKPDLIIHYSGANDLLKNSPDPRINYPHRFFLSEINPMASEDASEFKFLDALLMSSQFVRKYFQDFLYRRVAKSYLDKFQKNRPSYEDFIKLKIRALAENIKLGEVLSAAIGAKYIFIMQPILLSTKNKTGIEVNMRGLDEQSADLVDVELEKITKKISKDTLVLNFLKFFVESKDEIFMDEIHFKNLKTNTIIAAEIVRKITTPVNFLKKPNRLNLEWDNELDYAWWLKQKNGN